jgi:hypothetical protein
MSRRNGSTPSRGAILDGDDVSVSRSVSPESLAQGEDPGDDRTDQCAQAEGAGAFRGDCGRGADTLGYRGLSRDQEHGASHDPWRQRRAVVTADEDAAHRVPTECRGWFGSWNPRGIHLQRSRHGAFSFGLTAIVAACD